jgi:hypothetical protein
MKDRIVVLKKGLARKDVLMAPCCKAGVNIART